MYNSLNLETDFWEIWFLGNMVFSVPVLNQSEHDNDIYSI